MKRSYLVQRMTKPTGGFLGMVDNPFSFGGGLRNGGLSEDAMKLIRPIASFDYMGAAEFEYGAVPEALSLMAAAAGRKKSDPRGLVGSSFTVALVEVEPHWSLRGKPDNPVGEATIYLLSSSEDRDECEARIRGWAAKDYQGLKEATRLPSTLRPHTEFDGDVVAWLELNNGFFFTTDQEVFTAFARMFGVSVEVAA